MGALAAYLTFINILSFFLIGIDKGASYLNYARIPEKKLILLALFGGSIGIILGMFAFNNKVEKKRFVFFIPSLLCLKFVVALFGIYVFT